MTTHDPNAKCPTHPTRYVMQGEDVCAVCWTARSMCSERAARALENTPVQQAAREASKIETDDDGTEGREP